ncbi:CHAP domain-containing protein [Nocardioides sp. zg-DK7169]|uniref:CHAP domain-containing protein n=1 Tax=Nocardioides sp. zg-DK7169 TaxID=2736600 RepID=UPI001557C4C6|nr:CHAP domain-containing protein [Nocardioides sp. zg-DK7169]NPC98911.1 CHAP domain-containing protein [Nocardioides sp. zg-DK7169]
MAITATALVTVSFGWSGTVDSADVENAAYAPVEAQPELMAARVKDEPAKAKLRPEEEPDQKAGQKTRSESGQNANHQAGKKAGKKSEAKHKVTFRVQAKKKAGNGRSSISRSGHRGLAAGQARLPVAPNNARETVTSASRAKANAPGYCLAWSRKQAGIPARFPDAATAWHNAAGRHGGDHNPPRGAAVYWTGGSSGYGHIAISLGNGRVRSSDAAGSGRVGTIGIRELSREWGLRYGGWANTINGYVIPGVPVR